MNGISDVVDDGFGVLYQLSNAGEAVIVSLAVGEMDIGDGKENWACIDYATIIWVCAKVLVNRNGGRVPVAREPK